MNNKQKCERKRERAKEILRNANDGSKESKTKVYIYIYICDSLCCNLLDILAYS